MTFDPAVNQETGASGQRYQGITLTGWIRCNCDAHGKQVDVKQLYNLVPQAVQVSWSQLVGVRVAVRGSENQLPAEGLGPQDPRLSSPAEWERSAEELGVNMLQSVPSPTHPSHITLSQPFRIKCERYIFLKKCVRSSLLLILFLHVYVYV